MKLLIHGPREFSDYDFLVLRLSEFLSSFHDYKNLEIVSADSKGFCELVKQYANNRGIKFTSFHVDFEQFGRQANYICNQFMADYGKGVTNHCLVFWTGKSLILRNLVKEAVKTRMSVLKIPINEKR